MLKECRYFQSCAVGCAGADETCISYEPMPDAEALEDLAAEIRSTATAQGMLTERQAKEYADSIERCL